MNPSLSCGGKHEVIKITVEPKSIQATTEATSVPDGAGVGGSTSADGGGDDLAAIRMELTRIRAMATSFLQATTGEGGQDFAQDVLAAVTAIDGHVQTLEEARA